MNVVIYTRYSSHNQTEQSTIGQMEECKKFCERNNFNIIGKYSDEAKSGTKDDREQFLKMIKDSEKRTFQGIVVYQLDRFARNRYDSAIYKAKLKKNNVRVMSARENINDDASGIITESVLEGMAEYFSVELSQKVKRGMKINADNHYYNGGTIPLGYTLKEIESDIKDAQGRKIKKKIFIIDEETAPIIKKIYEMYLNGSTMAKIIEYLNNNNIKTSYGNEFNKNSIRPILTNKKYNGIYTYNGNEIKGGIPQIIDDLTFEMVQEKMGTNKKAPARARAKTDYLLTTKLFCGHCKQMMTGTSGTSKSGKLHTYYGCVGTRKKICNKKNVQKDFIENLVIEKARELLTSERIDKIADCVFELVKKEKNNSNIKRLNRIIKDTNKQKDNLFNSLKLCNIDSVKKSIFEEMAKMEEKINQLKTDLLIEESQCVNVSKTQIKFFLNHIKNGNIDDIRYKKAIINTLINKVFLYDDNIIIIFNTQDKKYEGKIPKINELECSLLGIDALPRK
ncbi:MAG: recombinase family protein [Bacilli bacterium]|nr:recombinase family protein [Bacilli bacterium]